MKQYLELLEKILDHGERKEDRTGTGTISIFGHQMRFDLNNGEFPIVTTKKIHWRSIVHELLWFISGDTNISYLKDNNIRIWNEWADEDGNLGKVYGYQWRSWDGKIDQIKLAIEMLEKNPNSRRNIVTSWNPSDLGEMALPPCHCLFQFYVSNAKLSLQLYQRSGDVFLGIPFNISSYALFTHMVANHLGLEPGEFIHTIGDAHIYLNHLEQAKIQLQRVPHKLPQLILLNSDIFTTRAEDITLLNYSHHPALYGKVSV